MVKKKGPDPFSLLTPFLSPAFTVGGIRMRRVVIERLVITRRREWVRNLCRAQRRDPWRQTDYFDLAHSEFQKLFRGSFRGGPA